MRRTRYSLHVIASTGHPRPVDAKSDQRKAIDAAEAKAAATGLEVRVWDTRRARCIYSAPSEEATS
jgi:hypothetical protein